MGLVVNILFFLINEYPLNVKFKRIIKNYLGYGIVVLEELKKFPK